MQEIVIFGAGQHARVVVDAAEKQAKFKVVAFVDDHKRERVWFDYPVWTHAEFRKSSVRAGLIAIGDNFVRKNQASDLVRDWPSFDFVSIIHPSAVIARGAEIAGGSFLAGGTVVNTGSRIGAHVIVNTSSSIDHDCVLGAFASIGPGATVCGSVQVGETTAVGAGAVILHGKHIGSDTVVGLGAVVVQNIPDRTIAFGNPCEVVREREPGESYL